MAGKTVTLGISGYLYRNAVLYYDSETETFWSQMTGQAVIGPLTGKRLEWIPTEVTTWAAWRKAHPKTTTIKRPLDAAEYLRTNDFYVRFRKRGRWMFPMPKVKIKGPYKIMDKVTIIVESGKARCYPHPVLKEGEAKDGDRKIVRKGISVRIFDEKGAEIPSMTGYWYAWCAFHPDGSVYAPPEKR